MAGAPNIAAGPVPEPCGWYVAGAAIIPGPAPGSVAMGSVCCPVCTGGGAAYAAGGAAYVAGGAAYVAGGAA